MLRPPPGIKVETAPSFDRNWYRVQTGLQFLLTLIVLAGLAGLFGGGWLSSKVVSVGRFKITYDRFARKTVPLRIVVRTVAASSEGSLDLTLGTDLTDKVAIIRTIPTAVSSKETDDGTEFIFASGNARPQSRSRSSPTDLASSTGI